MTGILATFSDLRIVKGRKVAQLVFEVALEQTDAALAILGGVPMPDRERWVGIAPVDESKITAGSASQPAGSLPPPGDAEEASPAAKPKQRWDDMRRSQRAGIMCADPRFWEMMGSKNEEEAARTLRFECSVDSRAELDDSANTPPSALQAFDYIETEYLAAIGRIARP